MGHGFWAQEQGFDATDKRLLLAPDRPKLSWVLPVERERFRLPMSVSPQFFDKRGHVLSGEYSRYQEDYFLENLIGKIRAGTLFRRRAKNRPHFQGQ